MGQRKAHQWIHVLLAVLQAARRTLGDAPRRSLAELAQRIGVAAAEAAPVVVPSERPTTAADPPTSPLLAMMAPNGASGAPRVRLSRRAVIVARKHAIR